MSANRALVVGASGIAGRNVAGHLASLGWEVDGLSRRAAEDLDGVTPVLADLRDADAVRTALSERRYTHGFYCSWSPQPTEAENCEVNGAMLRNVLDALDGAPLEHAALVTGHARDLHERGRVGGQRPRVDHGAASSVASSASSAACECIRRTALVSARV